mgnify:CR=1 FL=1
MTPVHIRASSFGSLLDCPARWIAIHMEGKRTPQSAAAALGTAIHDGTAVYDRDRVAHVTPSLSAAEDAAVESVRQPREETVWDEHASDKAERSHRFLEEALELVQACGCSASEAHQLVDYVFGRAVGHASQEAGGVMVTLAALCLVAEGLDLLLVGVEIGLLAVPGFHVRTGRHLNLLLAAAAPVQRSESAITADMYQDNTGLECVK